MMKCRANFFGGFRIFFCEDLIITVPYVPDYEESMSLAIFSQTLSIVHTGYQIPNMMSRPLL